MGDDNLLAIGSPILTIDAELTLADHVDFNIYLQDRPQVRRRRIAVVAASLLIGPILGIALGYMIGWSGDRHATSLAESVTAVPASAWRQGVGSALLISGALSAIAVLLHLLRRPILKRRLRGLVAERAGVDPSDPALPSRIRIGLGPNGFVVNASGSRTQVAASSVKKLGETRSILTIMVGRMTGFIIPKRCLSREQTDDFRAITCQWPIDDGKAR